MTKIEEAEMAMFNRLSKQLDDDKSIYSADTDMKDAVDAFNVSKAANDKASKDAHPDNSVYNDQKLSNKVEMSKTAALYSGLALVKFIKLGKNLEAEQLLTEPNDYLAHQDMECARLAQVAHDFLENHLEDLSPTTVTTEDLKALAGTIKLFLDTKGTSDNLHKVSPTLTKIYKASFDPVFTSIEHLRLVVRKYEKSNFDFFTRTMANMIVDTVYVRHTSIVVEAMLKSTGLPLNGLLVGFLKSKKTGVTNEDGIAEIDQIRSGKDTMICTLNGKEVLRMKITIKRSTTNHYNVVVEVGE